MAPSRRSAAFLLATLLAYCKFHLTSAVGSASSKRRCQSPTDMLANAAKVLNLYTPEGVYHMDSKDQYDDLIRDLWAGDFTKWTGRFSRANPIQVELFENMQVDEMTPRIGKKQTAWPRFEGVLSCLFRARSQKIVPLETAALSVSFKHYHVAHVLWDTMSYFTKAVMSRKWTEDLCEDAIKRNPNPVYETLAGMTGAVFDNFELKVGYGSYATSDSSAFRMEMTNWATVFFPAKAAAATPLSIPNLVGSGGIFRSDMRIADFQELFSAAAVDMLQNRRARWADYLNAASLGVLWAKQEYESPYPQTYFHWHEPMFGVMQSSYADVNFELEQMRNHPFHKHSDCVQLGGDGLSFMRLIHRLAQDPRKFLEHTPVVIPRLGEAPHGKYHVLHGGWRMWWPLLEKLAAVVGNRKVKRDPTVSEFNEHEHFLRIVVEALAQYVLLVSRHGGDYRHCDAFLNEAERNLSFAYICFFLHLFGFMYVQMRRAIRRNDSAVLDMIWRENLSTARASNKSNYSQMSVITVYWGCALREPLQTVFHNTRTLRWLDTHVGHDFPIEQLNNWIKEASPKNLTEDWVRKFIRHVPFTQFVNREVRSIMQANRAADGEHLKAINTDIALIVNYLKDKLGATWYAATTPSDDNLLGLDLADWGGDRTGQQRREGAPWKKMERSNADFADYVKQQVVKLCPWHRWV